MDKLFLIDGHALCYRSFYAIRELIASNGQATNAVFGFVNTMRKIFREFDPKYMAVCFDSKEKTFRAEKFADYKIQRPKMPEQLISQIPIIKEVIQAYNIPIFEVPGYEADDIIATLNRKANDQKIDVTIVTEDKDMFQLSGAKTSFFSARKDAVLEYKDVETKLGFEPIRIIDFIALAGDKADNIPGVAGVGEVTARKLIDAYGDLEGIYANVEQIDKVKVKEKLMAQKDIAFLSKELAILDMDVPVELDLESLKVSDPDGDKLYDLFKELEFKRFAEEYADGQAEEHVITLKTVTDRKGLKDVTQAIRKAGRLAYLVSRSEDTLFEEFYVATGEATVWTMPVDMIDGLKELFADPSLVKITHNCKEMFKFLDRHAITTEGETFDVLLAGYLLTPNTNSYDPKELAWNFFKISLNDENLRAKETDIVFKLYDKLQRQLEEKKLKDLYEKIERPLSYVLYKMETQGVCLDEAFLKQMSRDCQAKIEEISKRLYEMAGEEFNLNSPKQLGKILFERLELPVQKKTKTGYSTDEGVLTKLSEMHEFPSMILEYRQLAKLKSTYIDALPKLVDPKTHRIHAEFNQIGAETGRLSSRHPNLQNIPIRTELGRQVRKAIIPSANMTMLAADYSQIELRILAHLSKDKALTEAFNNDEDIHNYTASLIFDVEQKDVDYHMRDTAKRVNFGIVYGMSGFGLAKDLGISQKEAQAFIDRYFERYPGVKTFMDEQIDFCQTNGYVLTLFDRRRYIPEINSKNNGIRQFAQRQAINTPVQGSAADLMKMAMIDVQSELEAKKYKSRMLITVHDELVFEVDAKEKSKLPTRVKQIMEQTVDLSIPIKVDVKVGNNWLEMERLK